LAFSPGVERHFVEMLPPRMKGMGRGRLALLVLCCTALPFLLLRGSMRDFWEALEYGFRHSPGHTIIQSISTWTTVHHHVWRDWAIIFVHVPRTAGDSLRTHLFPSDDTMDLWRGAWQSYPPNILSRLEESSQLNWTDPGRRVLFKGFWSEADVAKLRETSWGPHEHRVKLFTVLRDPVERFLSVVKWLREAGMWQCNDTSNASALQNLEHPQFCQGSWGRHGPSLVRMFLSNGMTYQLGDYLTRLPRRNPEVAVETAKAFLQRMRFIAFYEDWVEDFYRLRDAVFLDFERDQEPEGWAMRVVFAFRRYLFKSCAQLARSRMRTRKFAAKVTRPEDWELIRRWTRHDQEVYNYALQLAGKGPNRLYDSYAEYFASEGVLNELTSLTFMVFCLTTWSSPCWCWRCWRARRLKSADGDALSTSMASCRCLRRCGERCRPLVAGSGLPGPGPLFGGRAIPD